MNEDKTPLPPDYDKDTVTNLITATYQPANHQNNVDFLSNSDLLELVSAIAPVPADELYQLMIDLGFKHQLFEYKIYWLIANNY